MVSLGIDLPTHSENDIVVKHDAVVGCSDICVKLSLCFPIFLASLLVHTFGQVRCG